MGKKLLIVESPTKAKTIGKYLGSAYTVKSSVGHIRDLPKDNGAIKIVQQGEGEWTFEPHYVVSDDKKKVVGELKAAVKSADEIYLASDPDREGEAIAWHLLKVLQPAAGDKVFHRVTYNEITRPAVQRAIAEAHEIDMQRVDAQQARRILDRIVGYKVSPLLWKYIPCANNRTLSAGRVQSVALRLLVERQREIESFVPEKYFLLGVEAKTRTKGENFVAKLVRIDGEKPSVSLRQQADDILLDLATAELTVTDIKRQPKVRRAPPPFTTSTLQQAASSVLGFSPGRTMKLAQALFEQGLITYMRTDSVAVSETARETAREYILANYGERYRPEKPNFFKSKATAQGAHEAIRPTSVEAAPGTVALEAGEAKLYDLIWRRFVASQMSEAQTTLRTVLLEARKPGMVHSYVFSASATEVDFDGFLKVMRLNLARQNEDERDSDEVELLPQLGTGETVDAVRWIADEKQTSGPKHYSEASLIKALEENGVGRPSTYAATIETLKLRRYAKSEKRQLVPLERGILVCDWLVKKLDSLFNVRYTAEMEAELDRIEEQGEPMNSMLSSFYSKFLASIAACVEPAPDPKKFDLVFSMLGEVQRWKEPKKIGKRVYDDQAFVQSVKDQIAAGKAPSARQFEFLVRMVASYAAQIPDAEQRLKAAGIGAGASQVEAKADEALVQFCFETMDRIGGMMKNPFLKSLREQVDRGRGLSPKQFGILARSVGENASALPDADAVRAKLAEYVPGGFASEESDPAIPGLLALMKNVQNWRPVVRKGKKVYDDCGFVASLEEQYSRRNALSVRQVMALRRVAVAYKDQIPDYDARATELGLRNVPSSEDKKARTIRRRKPDGEDES